MSKTNVRRMELNAAELEAPDRSAGASNSAGARLGNSTRSFADSGVSAKAQRRRLTADYGQHGNPGLWEQKQSAYNGHFEATCYHPLLFNWEGDCVGAKLRSGNVHSAEDREEVVLPEIECQQELGKEVVFRADAALAKPEIHERLEERGVKYAIWLSANDNLLRDTSDCWGRSV
jgi:hypothetical protein